MTEGRGKVEEGRRSGRQEDERGEVRLCEEREEKEEGNDLWEE